MGLSFSTQLTPAFLPLFAQVPADSISYLALGDSAYDEFDNAAALAFYEKALSTDSVSFPIRLKLSRTHYDYGLDLLAQSKNDMAHLHFEAAIRNAQELVASFPDSAQSHFMLAATMGNLAQFVDGKQKLALGRLVERHSRMAIELDSTLAYPYVALGIYYREVNQLNWLERAFAQMFFGRLPDISSKNVLALLLHAARLKPEFPFLHFELAMTYLMYDQPTKALNHLKTLISLSPENSQDIRNQQNARMLIEQLSTQ